MRSLYVDFLLVFLIGGVVGQYPGGSPPWGQGPSINRPYGKPSRPSPFSRPVPNYGKPVAHAPPSQMTSDDPIPANPALESSYESQQQLPSKLPILAPNGVVEIYNRVVDDLIQKLEISFKKRDIDPMRVVIRPTPATPVRVPGHLQKRPFRRPGAPLYRSNLQSMSPVRMKHARSLGSLPEETNPVVPATEVADEKPSFRGVGKISKGPLGEEKVDPAEISGVSTSEPLPPDTSSPSPPPLQVNIHLVDPKSVESSEEEPNLFRARSDEYFPDDEVVAEIEEKNSKSRTTINNDKNKLKKDEKKDKKKEDLDEAEDDEDAKGVEEGKKDVDKLLQRYQNKNVNDNNGGGSSKVKSKYTAGGGKKKEESGNGNKKKQPEVEEKEEKEVDSVVDEDDEEGEDNQDELDEGRPNPNAFYPPGAPIQQKPNAELTGLSKIKRASDVVVNVDARSALITARLLVGPLHVNINDSVEPLERNVRATIPELEAELILMERHGVVFLQRFTLDRAYGQDVEISMPKVKSDGKKKKIAVQGPGGPGPNGAPMDPILLQQRFQTKMAAHISMEVVKLLRSGNLRVNIMRTAQSSMSKLKLPIKTTKKTKKKTKKSETEDTE